MSGRILLPPSLLALPKVARFPRTSPPVPPITTRQAAGLPSVVSQAYNPPLVANPPPLPPVVNDGVGDDYESAFRDVKANNVPTGTSGGVLTVYTTQRRWQAVDVYIATNHQAASVISWITVGIYAVTRGIRSLVASGRVRGAGVLTTASFVRAATARVQADKFEIALSRTGLPQDPANMLVQVAVVASDEANTNEAESVDGATPTDTSMSITAVGFSGETAIPGEFVALSAINNSGAARYLQLCTTIGGTTLAAWDLAIGDTLQFTDATFWRRYRGASLLIRESSTPSVYTATTDCPKQVFFR